MGGGGVFFICSVLAFSLSGTVVNQILFIFSTYRIVEERELTACNWHHTHNS